MNLLVSSGLAFDPTHLDFELVERKGVGHPDTICDAISEEISRRYSRYCLSAFGRIAHHWVDKVLLYGGEADNRFGVGVLTKPYTVLCAGKCAKRVGSVDIPLDDILMEACVSVLQTRLTGFDAAKHLQIENRLVDHTGPGRTSNRYRPQAIEALPASSANDLVSNDCNVVSGFAPETSLERMVRYSENLLNGRAFKADNPDVGWDVKIVGSRRKEEVTLLVNVPFLAQFIGDEAQYEGRKDAVRGQLAQALREEFGASPRINLNPADIGGKQYLLALGSVADTGDVGVTGRGNRVNGLITPMRPMSIEAAAGKNPVDHTGKLYTVVAFDLAAELAEAFGTAVEVFIYTAKGTPTNDPDEVSINTERELSVKERDLLSRRVEATFLSMPEVSLGLVKGARALW